MMDVVDDMTMRRVVSEDRVSVAVEVAERRLYLCAVGAIVFH